MSDTLHRLTASLADRYAIERELGQGGMATVYLAEDLKHKRNVAVKVLRPELAAILGAERFLKEIEVTANLQHPNILPLYDSGEADTFLYYVMPHVEGESLREKMNREKQLGVAETVEIAKGVAGALQFAHDRGVVHRDIKPENILLQSGQPLVADFGIALAVSQAGGTRLTETGLSLGTPHYMSPEQATGDRDVDARSDVYSLGVLVYEMLAGEPPYLGNSVQAIIAKILSERPIPLGQSRDLLPPNVEAAVQQALAKSPADRFVGAAEFAAALTNPGFTLPTQAIDAIAPTWNRLTVGAVAALALAIVVAAIGWFRPDVDDGAPVLRYAMALPEEQALAPGRGSRISISPDGSRVALLSSAPSAFQIFLRRRDAFDAEPVPGTERSSHVFFSPDGSRLGFLVSDDFNGIKISSLGGGPPVWIADSAVGLDGATWSDDGFVYFDGLTAGGTNGIERVTPSGTLRERVTTVDTAGGEIDHIWPQALPGGRGVLFQVLYGGQERELALAVYGAGDATHRVLRQAVAARYVPSGHLVYVTSGGVLMGVRFDLERLETVGDPLALDDGVGIRPFGAVDITLSETGTLMYVSGGSLDEPDEIVWVDREGTAETIDPGWTGEFRTLALSPDGTSLAVSVVQGGEEQIWIKQLPRGPLSRLTFDGSFSRGPSWSPDGRSVLYVTNRDATESLWLKRADGSAVSELALAHEGRPVIDGVVTRDGRWIIYGTVPRDVLGRRIGDTSSVELIVSTFEDAGAAVSPDGRWIAYLSNESGRREIYVRPFPNTNDARWQISTVGGLFPFWSRDGTELFFVDVSGTLTAVEVVPGETFVAGATRNLFSVAPYGVALGGMDITPDGQRFVMIRGQIGRARMRATGDLIVVENFDQELKEKLPN